MINIHFPKQGHYSFFKGWSDWKAHIVVVVKLNCNNWTATYYKHNADDYDGSNVKQIQINKIKPNQSYHFAMLCCHLKQYTHLQIVKRHYDMLLSYNDNDLN